MIDPIDLSYTAGLIDADGSVVIGKQAAARYPRGYHLMPVIQVASIDEHIIDWLVTTFGGHKVKKAMRPLDRGIQSRFQSFDWRVGSQAALSVARQVSPYMRIKKKQAELLIEFYDGALWTKKGSANPGRNGGASVPDEEIQRRLAIREEVSSLNQRSHLQKIQMAA